MFWVCLEEVELVQSNKNGQLIYFLYSYESRLVEMRAQAWVFIQFSFCLFVDQEIQLHMCNTEWGTWLKHNQ